MVIYKKVVNLVKCILVFCIHSLVAHSSHALGFATGPSLGAAGFHTSFDLKQQFKKTSTNNLALQIGWFAKLDLWLLYAKLDALFVLDWRKLPNKLDRDHFKHITLPLTIGFPIFSLLRPHIGIVFHLPLDDLDDTRFKGNRLIENYRKKINGCILGLGIDLSSVLIDIYLEFARLSVAKKFISSTPADGDKQYRPKQFTLRVGYNLLG